jgi:hypothetical protein
MAKKSDAAPGWQHGKLQQIYKLDVKVIRDPSCGQKYSCYSFPKGKRDMACGKQSKGIIRDRDEVTTKRHTGHSKIKV